MQSTGRWTEFHVTVGSDDVESALRNRALHGESAAEVHRTKTVRQPIIERSIPGSAPGGGIDKPLETPLVDPVAIVADGLAGSVAGALTRLSIISPTLAKQGVLARPMGIPDW